MDHPLLDPVTRQLIESAVSSDLGRPWRVGATIDVSERSSHPALVLRAAGTAQAAHGEPPVA